MSSPKNLSQILRKYSGSFASLVPFTLHSSSLLVFDLSANNQELLRNDFLDTEAFTRYIFKKMEQANTPVAIGRYNENRVIYRRSNHFQGREARTIHLGIDIWAEAGTAVYCPLAGTIHSFQDNQAFGDYGPTIIVEHMLEGIPFYTLYGHLSRMSITDIKPQQKIQPGEQLGWIGNFPENGDWPPHLHFQLITDMQGHAGDFPGVAASADLPYYLHICPDPNLILNIEKLKS